MEFILIVFAFCILIASARLIGWALGISEVRKKIEKTIEQNNQILDALDRIALCIKDNRQ